MKIKCNRCKHEWDYTGEKKSTKKIPAYTSCSMCRASVRIPIVNSGEE